MTLGDNNASQGNGDRPRFSEFDVYINRGLSPFPSSLLSLAGVGGVIATRIGEGVSWIMDQVK